MKAEQERGWEGERMGEQRVKGRRIGVREEDRKGRKEGRRQKGTEDGKK